MSDDPRVALVIALLLVERAERQGCTRAEAREALRRTEERFAGAVTFAHDGVFEVFDFLDAAVADVRFEERT
jgi:hypothetical protein